MEQKIIIPLRLMINSLTFLYLVLPGFFSIITSELLEIKLPSETAILISIIYSSLYFIGTFLCKKEIVIRVSQEDNSRMSRIILFSILGVMIVFSYVIIMTGINFYFDKTQAHIDYEEINSVYHLRFWYNIFLIFFVWGISQSGLKLRAFIFFLLPLFFEMMYSKHNYATHCLVYLFICGWQAPLLYQKRLMFLFSAVVVSLLMIRFLMFSNFQQNFLNTLAAFLGEFTISWLSIPIAVDLPPRFCSLHQNFIWYSDCLTANVQLHIGLAGNPIAEAVYYFGDFALLFIIFQLSVIVVLSRLSLKSNALAVAWLVFSFYLRDYMRTGFMFEIGILIKAWLIYAMLIDWSIKVKRLFSKRANKFVHN